MIPKTGRLPPLTSSMPSAYIPLHGIPTDVQLLTPLLSKGKPTTAGVVNLWEPGAYGSKCSLWNPIDGPSPRFFAGSSQMAIDRAAYRQARIHAIAIPRASAPTNSTFNHEYSPTSTPSFCQCECSVSDATRRLRLCFRGYRREFQMAS